MPYSAPVSSALVASTFTVVHVTGLSPPGLNFNSARGTASEHSAFAVAIVPTRTSTPGGNGLSVSITTSMLLATLFAMTLSMSKSSSGVIALTDALSTT